MNYYVYIIYSDAYDKYYKGSSAHPALRLIQHNNGRAEYTKKFIPWVLVYLEKYNSKSDALKRERSLKKYAKSQILDLINGSHPNKVNPTDFPQIP
jgi:putative endonuclease